MRTEEEIKEYLEYLKEWESKFKERMNQYIETYIHTGEVTNLFFMAQSLHETQKRINILEWVLGKVSPIVYFTSNKEKEK